jgi:hypothetical protein
MDAILIVGKDGTTRHLVDPVSEAIAAAIGPKVSTQRSSHVETWRDLSTRARLWLFEHSSVIAAVDDSVVANVENGEDITNHFWADMLPVQGPVLGPFAQYADALAAEVLYLQRRDLPCPLETTDLSS